MAKVDKVKPIKFENSIDGTQNDEYETEMNPSEDYIATKGVAFQNRDDMRIELDDLDNDIQFRVNDKVTKLKKIKNNSVVFSIALG